MNPNFKVASLVILLSISGFSLADDGSKERTIDEYISIADPTVAPKKGGWVFGATAEYWSAKSKMEWAEIVDGKIEIADKESKGTLPGFGVYASNGPWSFQYARKSGSWDTTMKWHSNIKPNVNKTDYTEQEVNIRYLSGQFYGLAGYIKSEADETRTITDSRYVWDNGASSWSFSTTRSGPQLGIGWIASFTEKFGMRMDAKYAWLDIESTFPGGKVSSNGTSLNISETLFYRFTKNVNVQAGMKYGIIDGEKASSNDIIEIGAFGMVGYVF